MRILLLLILILNIVIINILLLIMIMIIKFLGFRLDFPASWEQEGYPVWLV